MPLLNYTTKVNSTKTLMELQSMLAKAGAAAILSEFDHNGDVSAISFRMDVNGKQIGFRLPADPKPVLYLIQRDPKVPKSLKTEEQAVRVAWRIIKDWVEAQLAIIETNMVKPEQAFLPYMLNANNKTVYEVFADNPQFLLGGGNGRD
jgi:hypothetical protein